MLDKTRCKTFSYSRCFITTLDDDQMRTAVWWTKPKIGFLMEPHRGFPHIKASVYDCPSNGGRVVYEYMRFKFLFRKSFSCNVVPCSTTMANDARLGGPWFPKCVDYVMMLHIEVHSTSTRRAALFMSCPFLLCAPVLAVAWRCGSLGCRPHSSRVRVGQCSSSALPHTFFQFLR